jgi:Na+/H+-translocating membrane pyrophosphatase
MDLIVNPLADTSAPAMNTLIKPMAIVALVTPRRLRQRAVLIYYPR